ncbi:hypothetical protein AMS68_005931 [Peltaster fructicola]|uniref:Dihydrofolate reductase n=1 Tax=Peltaster fructicola TaxID=286661 RepID=A0A6H0Y090_9PEZI|nr:hypothetical protein AMS68_005931 [Peltaster fructicola]
MSLSNVPITLIVAATKKNGIGKNGGLPWPMLKKEMAYFARVTKRVPLPTNTGSLQSDTLKQTLLVGQRQNVVVMGRKTWESIPPRLRPLKDRTNIVISSQTKDQLNISADGVIVASSILSGLQELERMVKQGEALPVGRTFVIGGTTIYRAALQLPQTQSILLTRIEKDFDCDTTFPIDLEAAEGWQRSTRPDLERFVGEDIPEGRLSEGQKEDEVQYEFQLYEKL